MLNIVYPMWAIFAGQPSTAFPAGSTQRAFRSGWRRSGPISRTAPPCGSRSCSTANGGDSNRHPATDRAVLVLMSGLPGVGSPPSWKRSVESCRPSWSRLTRSRAMLRSASRTRSVRPRRLQRGRGARRAPAATRLLCDRRRRELRSRSGGRFGGRRAKPPARSCTASRSCAVTTRCTVPDWPTANAISSRSRSRLGSKWTNGGARACRGYALGWSWTACVQWPRTCASLSTSLVTEHACRGRRRRSRRGGRGRSSARGRRAPR